MPEGDTIHRTANRLRPALIDKELVRFEAPRLVGDRPRSGDRIVAVEAVGKNLLIRFEAGLVLRTHMKMTGSWHLYQPGERWRKPRHLLRALVDVGDWLAVCFAAPIVETWHERSSAPTPIDHLGPDLCVPEPDIDEVLRRMAGADESLTIDEALLDQRIACGIGNVFKSEVLWAVRTWPFTHLGAVSEGDRRRMIEIVARQLRANLGGGERTTVPGGLAVYGRERQPCRACATPVQRGRRGPGARATWWCPTCQPES